MKKQFEVTHKITYAPVKGAPQIWDVMLMPDEHEDDDQGIRAAYTRAEFDCVAPSDWERDAQGRWWFQGQAALGNGTVTVSANTSK